MTTRRFAVAALAISATAGAIIWFLSQDSTSPEPPVTKGAPTATPDLVVTAPEGSAPSPSRPPAIQQATPSATAPDPSPVLTEDDRKIDEILRLYPGNSDSDHTNTAQALINTLPTLTKEGQVECAQHISNLLSDDEFKRVMHIWKNPNFNPEVLEVLSTDLMNREHKVLLPALLDAVRLPTHPFHEEAQSTLEIFLDADYGTDFTKWDAAVKEFLRLEAEEAK
jgi:hypothetical protein